MACSLGWGCSQTQADPAVAAPGARPDWWGNSLGRDEVVLPGFDPVQVDGTRLTLGARTYDWQSG